MKVPKNSEKCRRRGFDKHHQEELLKILSRRPLIKRYGSQMLQIYMCYVEKENE